MIKIPGIGAGYSFIFVIERIVWPRQILIRQVFGHCPFSILLTLLVICVTLLDMISERIAEIRRKIEKICALTGRDPREITLIAVTKYASVEQMQELLAAGPMDIGESRLQDAQKKFDLLEREGLVFKRHMIGHLQSNKVKEAVRLFGMIQSVDSLKTAQEIDRHSADAGKTMDILVQVNSSNEAQKSGVHPDQAMDLLEEMSQLSRLRILGLMTIGLLSEDKEKVAQCFELTQTLFERAKQHFAGHARVKMQYLSMGMTQDYEIALEHGSNMIRIGSAIFEEKL